MTYLAAQLLDIDYDKSARGGDGAVARARVASGLPLLTSAGDGVLHECRMASWDQYQRRETVRPLQWRDGALAIAGRIRVHLDEGLLIVPDPGAEPWATPPRARLALGAWTRMCWNERRGQHEHRWFGEVVLNIGLFTARPPRGVFLAAPPTTHDLRRDLLRNGSRAET